MILDNVSEPGLLGASEISTLPAADWLRIIATTRLDPSAIDPARKSSGLGRRRFARPKTMPCG